MTTSNFDLCKPEWLELVFAKRNKEYGAYYLRQHNAANINKAMAITFITVTALFLIGGKLLQAKPVEIYHVTQVTSLVNPVKTDPVKPKEEVHRAKPSSPKPPVTSTKYPVPVVTAAPVKEEPTRIDKIVGEVGPENITVPGDGPVTVDDGSKSPGGAGGTGIESAIDNTIHNFAEENPEPIGGAAAWAKFLQKNLRYPAEAVDKGISGKVYVSFVVEKDGHLSSFEIVRGMGYGMDDESLRVLRKAPAWKPGKQNGQPVRVKYTLPLNFVLGDNQPL